MDAPWPQVIDVAARAGLHAEVRTSADGTINVLVSRPHELGGWALVPTKIAFGHDPNVVAQSAIAAIRKAGPRLAKLATEGTPDEPDGITIAGGVGSDGTVTALRVERDGTVRLSAADIADIAQRVWVLKPSDPIDFRPKGFSATVMDAGGGEVKLRLDGGEEYPEVGTHVRVEASLPE